jgi:hypothetical protein
VSSFNAQSAGKEPALISKECDPDIGVGVNDPADLKVHNFIVELVALRATTEDIVPRGAVRGRVPAPAPVPVLPLDPDIVNVQQGSRVVSLSLAAATRAGIRFRPTSLNRQQLAIVAANEPAELEILTDSHPAVASSCTASDSNASTSRAGPAAAPHQPAPEVIMISDSDDEDNRGCDLRAAAANATRAASDAEAIRRGVLVSLSCVHPSVQLSAADQLNQI